VEEIGSRLLTGGGVAWLKASTANLLLLSTKGGFIHRGTLVVPPFPNKLGHGEEEKGQKGFQPVCDNKLEHISEEEESHTATLFSHSISINRSRVRYIIYRV
jgi:hypothetical protein